MAGLKTKTAKIRRTIAVLSTVGLVSVGIVPAATSAQAVAPADLKSPQRVMSGWLPYWTTAESKKSFVANADLFSHAYPFWHNAVKSSNSSSKVVIKKNSLSSGTHASVLSEIQGKGALVLPSITDGTGAGHMSKVLRNSSHRTALVNQISNLVNSKGYDGIDLDFETFAFSDGQASWTKTLPAWTAFVVELGARLHAGEKKLAVTVPPVGVSGTNYWVYNPGGIGPHIDKLNIMAYDYSWCNAGPIGGPLSWVDKVAAYAASVMAPSKVQLGTPTYGRDWVNRSGCNISGQKVYASHQLSTAIPGKPASAWKRDPASQERYLNYTTVENGKTVSRSSWLPDSITVAARARIASKYGLGGLATWTLGGEQKKMWAAVRDIASSMPFGGVAGKKSQKISRMKVSPKRGVKGRKVSVSGKVKPVRAGKKVTLHKCKKNWKKCGRIRTDRTSASGKFTFRARATGKKTRLKIRASGNNSLKKAVKYVTLKNW